MFTTKNIILTTGGVTQKKGVVNIMRLSKIKRKNATHYYIIDSYRDGSKVTSRTIKKLGSDKEIMKKYNVKDAEAWAKEQVNKANALKSAPRKNQNSSKFKGVEYIRTLYDHFKLSEFAKEIEKEEGCVEGEIDNLLFFVILNCLYFPDSCFLNVPFFLEGYFREQGISLEYMNVLFSALAKKSDKLIELLQNHNNLYQTKGSVFLVNVELSKSLILPKSGKHNKYLAVLFDANAVPITMLHDSFAQESNKKHLKKALDDFGFVDIFVNEDKMSIGSMLPNKAKLKEFKRLSLKEAKSMTKADLSYNDTWNKYTYEQKSFLKGFSDVLYKTFPIKGDNDYIVAAVYSTFFEVSDSSNKINVNTATLDNPQCSPKVKENINNYISESVYNNRTNGYRFYLLPKEMPVYHAASFDYQHSVLLKAMNAIPYSNLAFVKSDSLEDYTIGSQLINYIASIFAFYTIRNSNFYVSSLYELSFFLQSIDASAFSKQFSRHIEQLKYRLGSEDL